MRNSTIPIFLLLTLFSLQSTAQTPPDILNTIFPSGDKIEGGNFEGTVWVKRLLPADSAFNAALGNVIFEPQARSKWHKHPGGQTLIGLDGMGYYQEKGKPLQILRKGDVVRCPPDIEHWHGASHDSWFVQLAITPEHPEGRVIWLHEVTKEEYEMGLPQNLEEQTHLQLNELEPRHRHFVAISSLAAKGDLGRLTTALHDGLDAGLTVNEIKEVLVHLYAYCGFPRSIQGLNTLISVLETRKAQGIADKTGKTASAVTDTPDKYERGKKVLETLTGKPQITPPQSGYGAFSPEIDVFLKEHLFADIFGRDVLSFKDREIATISALANLGGVSPMLKGHIGIALHLGFTEAQLMHLLAIVESTTGMKEAENGRKALSEVMEPAKK
ncbi:MAG: carboxymuconolactone decarboxylase family protein [Lewinellaceae bacterium]|nr:carboxymuconolactone decarboxylase family protein [Lewinellaceae bacterium]MCB9285805.1 carboxymuconolactone decarboxylase family protein [Lewinellaceae bacterium]